MPEKESSTEHFVEIEEIRGPVVILRDGSMRAVVESASLNFDLRSSEEKIAIVRSFQDFLNSVDFPLQIVIDSRRLDITEYLTKVNLQIQTLDNELLRIQANAYTKFIAGLADLANVVTKRFYVIIPFYISEAPIERTGIWGKFKGIFAPQAQIRKLSDEEFNRFLVQLDQRIAVIRSGIERLGIRTSVLNSDELTKLYYSYYNPQTI